MSDGQLSASSDIYNRASTVCFEIHIRRECWCGGFSRESWCAGLFNRFQRMSAAQARGVAARLVTTRVNENEENETGRNKEKKGVETIRYI